MFKKLRGIFGLGEHHDAEKASPQDIPTIPIPSTVENALTEQTITPNHPEVPQLIVGCSQSIGRIRDHNEDSILVLNILAASNGANLPIGLFIVADGMGGHKQGEIASSLAVRTVAREALRKVMIGLLEVKPTPPEEGIQEILEKSVIEAHLSITKEAPGSGTTLTAILIVGRQMSIAHVGDSRAYAITPFGEANILTRDHSLVKRMIELGHLTEEEATNHPQRNVLYRALGQGEPFTPDVSTSPIPSSGHLLICSDGLWGLVPQPEIVRLILSVSSPEIACQMLVDAANAAGGHDNISAILIKLPQYSD